MRTTHSLHGGVALAALLWASAACAQQSANVDAAESRTTPEEAAATITAEDMRARIAKAYPLRRIGRPEDVTGAVLFLASDAAGFITCQTLSVSGGYTMMSLLCEVSRRRAERIWQCRGNAHEAEPPACEVSRRRAERIWQCRGNVHESGAASSRAERISKEMTAWICRR